MEVAQALSIALPHAFGVIGDQITEDIVTKNRRNKARLSHPYEVRKRTLRFGLFCQEHAGVLI